MRVSESHSANAQPAHPADHRCTHLRNVRGRSECRLASGTRLRAPCEAHAEPEPDFSPRRPSCMPSACPIPLAGCAWGRPRGARDWERAARHRLRRRCGESRAALFPGTASGNGADQSRNLRGCGFGRARRIRLRRYGGRSCRRLDAKSFRPTRSAWVPRSGTSTRLPSSRAAGADRLG